ncbi:winged helix-turn-helix domain-containing protein [Pseudoalteromonas sp. SS15]|uniref:winged helix-turn-helix domain-containing protein n=1 Tax=Pseudoalteromonas sp. SS15 TaxID=3139393 RepID=UPI003BAC5786
MMKEFNFSSAIVQVKFAQWELDPKRQVISDGDISRELEPLLYKLLCYFLLNNEEIITREDLIEHVWRQHYVDDNAINRAVSELRKLLKSDKFKGTIIKTHYRKGYSLAVDRELVGFDGKQNNIGVINTPAASIPSQPKHPPYNFSLRILLASCVVFVLAIIGYWFIHQQGPTQSNEVALRKFSDASTQILSWQDASFSQLKVHPNNNVYAYVTESGGEQGITVQALTGEVSKQISFAGSKLTLLGFSAIYTDVFYREENIENECGIWRVNYLKDTPAERVMECGGDIRSLIEYDDRYLVFDRLGYRDQQNIRAIYTYDKVREQTSRITAPGERSYGDYLQAIDIASNKIYFLRVLPENSDVFYTDIEGSYASKLFSDDLMINNLNFVNDDLYFFGLSSQSLYKYDEINKQSIEIKKNDSKQAFQNVFKISESQSIAQTLPFEVVIDLHSFSETKKVNLDYKGNINSAIRLKQSQQLVVLALFPASNSSILSFYDDAGTKQQEISFDEHSLKIKPSLDERHLFVRHNKAVSVLDLDGKLIKRLEFEGKVLTIEVMSGGRLAAVEQIAGENNAVVIDVLSGTRKRLPIKDIMWFSCFEEYRCLTQNFYGELRVYDLRKLGFESQIAKTDTIFPTFTRLKTGFYFTDREGMKQFDLKTFAIKEHLLLPKEVRENDRFATILLDETSQLHIRIEPRNNEVVLHSFSLQ